MIEYTAQYKEIVALTCRVAVKFFKVDHSAVVIFSSPHLNQCTEGYVVAEYPNWGVVDTVVPVQGVPAEETLLFAQKPLYFTDVFDDGEQLGQVRGILNELSIASILIVPIIHRGQVIGSFSLDSREPHFAFADEEILQCQVLAEQVSASLSIVRRAENRSTPASSSYLLQRLQRTHHAMRTMGQASITAELPTILQSIATSIRSALRCDAVSCYAYDPDVQELRFPPGTDGLLHLPPRRSASEVSRDSVIYRIINDLKDAYHYTEDTANDPLLRSNFVLQEGFVTSACLRLMVTGRTVGVLFINYRHPYQMSSDELEDLQMFANAAAVAVENALREQKRQEGQERLVARTIQRWLSMVNSAWGHEIGKKATNIIYEVYALRRLIEKGNHNQSQPHLDRIARLANEIADEPFTLPLASEEGVESVLVVDLLQERLAQLKMHEEFSRIIFTRSFQLPAGASVRVNPDWMKEIIDSVVKNAAEAMARSTHPLLKVSAMQQGTQVHISFTDTGPGIPEAVQPRLFKEPIPKAKGSSGSGISLMFAAQIARTYGGELQLESSDESGTTVVILLPLE